MIRSGIGSADIRDVDAIVDSSSGGDGSDDIRRRRCRIINSFRRTLILSSFATFSLSILAMTTRSREEMSVIIEVPSCTNTPWKSDEDLRRKRPESFKSVPSASSIPKCATSCCEDLDCITWQYRADVGCRMSDAFKVEM